MTIGEIFGATFPVRTCARAGDRRAHSRAGPKSIAFTLIYLGQRSQATPSAALNVEQVAMSRASKCARAGARPKVIGIRALIVPFLTMLRLEEEIAKGV